MATYKKYILPAILVIAGAGGLYAYKEYNRKPVDLTDVAPQQVTNVQAIVNMYDSSEASANEKYLGKTVEIKGIVSEVNNEQDTLLTVMLGDSNDMHRVSCLLDKAQLPNLKKCMPGKEITIKGICTGYLLDVELNRCVIVAN
jgi:hypothetical protein